MDKISDLGANVTLNVKASAGSIFSIYCLNLNVAARYLQIHNTATTPAGSAVPALTFLVPPSVSGIPGVLALDSSMLGAAGNNFSSGIAFAFSTTVATYTAGAAADQITEILFI
jgi:hypothetical protein